MGTDIHPYVEVWTGEKWQPEEIRLCADRNYWSFAILANVRNGYGVAGVATGESVQPISKPRGLPENTSIVESDDIWLGEHSFSWITLAELQAYNLDRTFKVCGYVDAETYRLYQEMQKQPETWCGGTSDPSFKFLEWERPLREAAWLLVKWQEQLKNEPNPEQVRIVFGFDS